MEVSKSIKLRRSVREYIEKEVEEEKLNKILEAARLAPSASNRQEWRFIVVKDRELRRKLAEASKGQKFVGEAPVVIACLAITDEYIMSCGQMCYPIDVAIAIDHMTLQAVELGLGTCWIGAFFSDKVREILEIPEEIKIVELLTLGYPKNPLEIKEKNRIDMETMVHWEKW